MHQTSFGEKILFAVIFLMIIPLSGLWGQSRIDTTKQVRPLQVENDFDITAGLENPAWDKAHSVFIEHQVQPNDNAPAPVETEVKVLYSQHNLYIGFICKESPEY